MENKLKFILIEKRVRQRELAEKIGVTEGTVSRWCNDVTQPNLIDMKNIAKALNINVNELI
jgi:putative transcriptional regulator